ncbi:DUF2384 domain-containing protein [Amylibacter sp. SFDW26]|uniref:antitoxin Xre/MbcA/ParS toxin-binding domain-containing protein n=1 Tax=Amylibacter sp. SFDW26 TaxID=2652722 RepID=UPI001262AA14|nr:antitoxin Xre/MbcA/ParS toxin-binding domain-containing protein [Amylibacter sp. SFDW26]KAB7614814.1 DUF2384 domain-containing protein [Amylibacter sp. SFDW26]
MANYNPFKNKHSQEHTFINQKTLKVDQDFKAMVKILQKEKPYSPQRWEAARKRYATHDDVEYAKALNIDIDFVPWLRKHALNGNLESMVEWMDRPNHMLGGATPRQLRAQRRGRHCFQSFIARLGR